MKIKVHRLVKVWTVDTYEVENNSEECIIKAIDFETPLDCYELWETCEPLGPMEVYNEKGELIFESDE